MSTSTHDSHGAERDTSRVVSTSNRNANVRTVLVDRAPPEKASFYRATLKGMGVTIRHFFTNVSTKRDIETIEYPEEKAPYPPRNRGLHRLLTREDGRVRCVACMCCPTVCPANCITIVPAESDDPKVEKFPAVFEIDELRCVVCGLCEEACPCDAIRMDTLVHAMPVEHRADAIETKESLMARSIKSTAVQGGSGANWRKHADEQGPRRKT